jgi:hypothetical protein
MEAVPGARRMAVLADPAFTPAVELQELQNAARARGMEVSICAASAVDQIALPSLRPKHQVRLH